MIATFENVSVSAFQQAKSEYIKQDLKERGWTRGMICKWLGNPDYVGSRYGGGEIHYFKAVRVHSAESTPAWVAEKEKWETRAAKAKSPTSKTVDILAALWAINRHAKRCKNAARAHYRHGLHGFAGYIRDTKEKLYSLKGQALEHLVREGRLKRTGHHTFGHGTEVLWGEILTGEGYTFHRPCFPPKNSSTPEARPMESANSNSEHQFENNAVEHLGEIEARPRTCKEPRLKDAERTVREFLSTRPHFCSLNWEDIRRAEESEREYLENAEVNDGDFDWEDEDEEQIE